MYIKLLLNVNKTLTKNVLRIHSTGPLCNRNLKVVFTEQSLHYSKLMLSENLALCGGGEGII